MNENLPSVGQPHLAWVFPGSLHDELDAATWLETTQELRALGWRVTLIAAGPAGEQTLRGVTLYCIPRPDVYVVRQVVYHLRVLRFLLQQRASIDVILFNQMSAIWLLPLRFARRLLGGLCPLLVMDTRTVPMTLATWKDRVRALFYKSAHWMANRWADGQTAITQRMAEVAGIPVQKLWGVWPSGVNSRLFLPAQSSRQWPRSGEPIHLVYIGALYEERGLLPLCQAVERAHTEGMAFVLTVVGSGPQRGELEAVALQSDGRIRVGLPVPHAEIPGILADNHVGTLPFPDEEKFQVSSPIKLFEYMASGLAVLATRIACHTDVVGHGEFAFWAEEATEEGLLGALRMIWEDAAELSDKGEEAATAAESWTWQATATKLSDALERGMSQPKSAKLQTLGMRRHANN